MIPSSSELDAWLETLRGGYASKEMLPRVIDGYKKLLKVAEAAGPCVVLDSEGAFDMVMLADWDRLAELGRTLEALEAPMPETERE